MREFWALVDNSRRMRKSGHFKSTVWGKLYIALFALTGVVGFSILIYQDSVGPLSLLIAIPYLAVIGFGLGIGSIRHEWKNQTAPWWLTLPYSRAELAAAKLTANFLRLLGFSVATILILAMFAFIGMLLNPLVWSPATLALIAKKAIQLYLLVMALSPVAISLGMLLAVVLQSRLKPLAPIVWALIVMLFITAANRVSHIFIDIKNGAVNFSLAQIPFANLLTATIIGVIAIIGITAALLGISAYILTGHTEV